MIISKTKFLNRFNCHQLCSFNLTRINLMRDARLISNFTNLNSNEPQTKLFTKYQVIIEKIKDELKKSSRLNESAEQISEIETICNEIKQLEQFDLEDENEFKDLVKNDLKNLSSKFNSLKNDLIESLYRESYLTDEIAMEFENGVGGNEAMIFTKEMVDFYIQFCRNQNWSVDIVEISLSNGKLEIRTRSKSFFILVILFLFVQMSMAI